MLKNRASKIKTFSKNDFKIEPQSDFISRVLRFVAALVAQTTFVIKKWAPSAPKVPSRIEK